MAVTVDQHLEPLPLTIEDIDATWLSSALSVRALGLEVTDFEIVDVRHGFTTILRIRLDLNDAGRAAGMPSTVMLKGGFEPHSRARSRTYVMETLGCRDVWPHIGMNMPVCFFAGAQPERQQAIIIMEDLTARGVTFFDPLAPRTYAQVERQLSALADVHAKTWEHRDIAPGGRWYEMLMHNGQAIMRDYLFDVGYFEPDVWQGFVDLPRGRAISTYFHDVEWAKKAMDHLAAVSEQLPKCVIHGDTHMGNIYLDADGTPGFIDSFPRIEPPHYEVAYHITCALDPVDRRRWDRALVAHYLRELRRHDIAVPDLDEMMYYFGLYLAHGYIVFLINESYYQTEAFNTAHASRMNAAMIDHHTRELIDAAT